MSVPLGGNVTLWACLDSDCHSLGTPVVLTSTNVAPFTAGNGTVLVEISKNHNQSELPGAEILYSTAKVYWPLPCEQYKIPYRGRDQYQWSKHDTVFRYECGSSTTTGIEHEWAVLTDGVGEYAQNVKCVWTFAPASRVLLLSLIHISEPTRPRLI
eukprot:2376965-Rhodomonas_salina.1